MRIAVVQMTSGDDLALNLRKMEAWTKEASAQKADCICFPELASLMAPQEKWLPTVSQFEKNVATFAEWAKKYNLGIIPGSMREPVKGDPNKFYNSLPFITPEGKVTTYRKIFLFRADLPGRKYDETQYVSPGDKLVVTEFRGMKFGHSVCFDLRFPELFRSLRRKGAQVIFLPSSFTIPTGKAHWETLLRARAIENQCFMVAPAQIGKLGNGHETFGHALVVSPWGEIKLDLGGEGEGMSTCEIDLKEIAESEAKVSAWACRRDDVFGSSQ